MPSRKTTISSKIFKFGRQKVMSILPLLTDEELIGKVINAAHADEADDKEDDDDDAVLDPLCPKISNARETLQLLHD